MSPSTRRLFRESAASRSAGAASGSTPDLAGSWPAFTWRRTGSTLPASAAARSRMSSSFTLSTLWILSKFCAASRALFDWRCPMSSQATAAEVIAFFSSPSCTRFSPTARMP